MPVLHRERSLTFFFWSNERGEPAHVSDRRTAKFWLAPVRLAERGSLRDSDIARATRTVTEHEVDFLAAWNAFFAAPRR